MGLVTFQVLPRPLRGCCNSDGRTITAEAVEYPAVAVPADGDLLGWGGFMSSVDAGTAALGAQYASFAALPGHQGGVGGLLTGRDGGAPQLAGARRQPQRGCGAVDRRTATGYLTTT